MSHVGLPNASIQPTEGSMNEYNSSIHIHPSEGSFGGYKSVAAHLDHPSSPNRANLIASPNHYCFVRRRRQSISGPSLPTKITESPKTGLTRPSLKAFQDYTALSSGHPSSHCRSTQSCKATSRTGREIQKKKSKARATQPPDLDVEVLLRRLT